MDELVFRSEFSFGIVLLLFVFDVMLDLMPGVDGREKFT